MALEVGAVYENGTLRLDHPLPVADKQRVRVTVHLEPEQAPRSRPRLEWQGRVEDLEYLAESPENSPWGGHDA